MADPRAGPRPADVLAAARRISGVAHRTPVLRSRLLDEEVGARLYFKCENFQRAGAFKFRGAYNALSSLTAGERANGVVGFSSGNHAQALALAGRILEIPVAMVMPTDAPLPKREATRAYGAEIVLYDREAEDREEIADRLRSERDLTIVPPYDHPDIIAGQGTAALELFDQAPGLDSLLVPCGGGGLLAGSALAAEARGSGCRVIGVEPETADDATRSFRSGRIVRVENPPTIADGLRTPSLGRYTFPVIRERVSEMVTVPEEAIVQAMRLLLTRMKIVVEPSGAVPLAALISGAVRGDGRRIGLILSGGNVDPARFAGSNA